MLTASIIGCGGCGSNPVDPEDTTRPTVVSTTPTDSDTTVAMSSEISVTFSERMDPGSLVEGVLLLEPSVAGSTSATATTVTFTPTDGLDTNVTYTATVATSAQDTAGNNLATPYVWQFRTYLDTLPPTIIETTPTDSNTSVGVNTNITVVFSETMDRSTLSLSSFQISPSVSGVINSTDTSMTFDPDNPLDTLEWYTVTLATSITDTIGNHLAETFVWDFYTYPDTTSPVATIQTPLDGSVINNLTAIQVGATDNDQIAYVEFYVDDNLIPDSEDSTTPYEYVWDASGQEIGSEHTILAVAYDLTGNSASTDTVTVHYLWRLAITDGNEPMMPRNLSRVWYRTTNQQIQFRVETHNGWGVYNDSATGINVVFFLDTDQNQNTGDTETDSLSPKPIGDIGADYQMVIGFFGLYFQPWTGTGWGAFEGVEDLVMADSTNVFEVALSLARLNDPEKIDLVLANVHINIGFGSYSWDWAPDSGHATAVVDRSFSPLSATRNTRPDIAAASIRRVGPFD